MHKNRIGGDDLKAEDIRAEIKIIRLFHAVLVDAVELALTANTLDVLDKAKKGIIFNEMNVSFKH